MVSKGSERFVLWPHYFDARLSHAGGRRVAAAVAVPGPDVRWVEVAAKRAGLSCEVEEDARHPRVPYERSGRVLVAKKGPKQAMLKAVAAEMRASADKRA
jgi:signal recognition particle subunit SEC65